MESARTELPVAIKDARDKLEGYLKDMAEQVSENRKPTSQDRAVIGNYLQSKLGFKEHEVFAVMYLDAGRRLIEFREMSCGSILSAPVYPREIAKTALQYNASFVILAHNHLSGQMKPSLDDLSITETIMRALSYFDITVIDHYIVSMSGYFSMAKHHKLPIVSDYHGKSGFLSWRLPWKKRLS